MAISETTSESPLQAAVHTTLLRRVANGRFWCPQYLQEPLAARVAMNGVDLLNSIHQAVRLVRIADRIEPRRGYEVFFHVRLKSLREEEFRREIGKALAEGRLAGVASATGDGVRLDEPAMASPSGKAFDLATGQMPEIAAVIDIVHNMVWHEARDILSGVTGTRPERSARDVANALHARVRAFIAEHSEASHAIRQASWITAFLKASGRLGSLPDALDDAAILDFWEGPGLDPEAPDGFRRFRNAARRMLVWRMAWIAKNIEKTFLSYSQGVEEGGFDLEALEGRRALARTGSGDTDDDGAEGFVSPLSRLVEEPASRVKWISGKGKDALADLVADSHADDDDASGEDGSCLFPDGPPDGAFARTFVRYAWFGRLQDRCIEAARRKRPLDLASEGNGYAEVADRIGAIGEDVRLAAEAATRALLDRGHLAGASALMRLAPEDFRAFAEEMRSGAHGMLRNDPATIMRLWRARIDQPDNAVGKRLRDAYRAVNREGFRSQDADDPDIGEALAAGVEPAFALARLVAQALPPIAAMATAGAFEGDAVRFHAVFTRLYGRSETAERPDAGAAAAPAS